MPAVPAVFHRVRCRGQGASFRQIQQRYEPHPGTLRAIEIVENSPTWSERPQPTAHAPRDRGGKHKHLEDLKEGMEEETERRYAGRRTLSANIYQLSRKRAEIGLLLACAIWVLIYLG